MPLFSKLSPPGWKVAQTRQPVCKEEEKEVVHSRHINPTLAIDDTRNLPRPDTISFSKGIT